MQTEAAILREAPGKFEVVTVELDGPRRNELLIKMVSAGLCHSDNHIRTGATLMGHLPMVMGHEGAGIVEAVGPDTPGWEIGDHVVFSFIPSCGKCRWCSRGMTNLCDLGAFLLRGSRFDDVDSFRAHLPDGTDVGQNCGLGTFAEHTVITADSAVKVDSDLPLQSLSLLGCGVGTGWGSAVYSADTQPGDVITVMGVGGIGINAVQGASHAGATVVIAVDPVEFKRSTALSLGATHAFASMAEADEFAKSITNGQGADKAIITVGVLRGDHVAEGVAAIRKGGTVVVTGLAAAVDVGIPVSPFELVLMQKNIQGSLFGACNPRDDIPRQVEMYRSGQLKLDELITTKYALNDINTGFDDLIAGRNMRGVVVFDSPSPSP